MRIWFKENWFNLVIVIILVFLMIAIVYSEQEVTTLNKWSRLCSRISLTEMQVRKALDIKMGDREKEWCKDTFYRFFK